MRVAEAISAQADRFLFLPSREDAARSLASAGGHDDADVTARRRQFVLLLRR